MPHCALRLQIVLVSGGRVGVNPRYIDQNFFLLKLITLIKRKHPGMLMRGANMLRNVCSLVITTVHDTLRSRHWKVMDHSPQSLNLPPRDFRAFWNSQESAKWL